MAVIVMVLGRSPFAAITNGPAESCLQSYAGFGARETVPTRSLSLR